MRRRKRCRYCERLFLPHPAVGSRQKSCGAADCREARKAEAQRSWVAANPDYFRGRYQAELKDWLREHPGYLRRHRQKLRQQSSAPAATGASHAPVPVGVSLAAPAQARTRARAPTLSDIQDELTALSRSVSGIMAVLERSDIQDELALKTCIQSGKGAIQTG